MITLDTSGLFALLNRRDRDHERVRDVLRQDRGPYIVPAGILAEISYLIERSVPLPVLDRFLADLEDGADTVDCGDGDLTRIRKLVRRYASLPLGFADACVIACTERRGGRVLTLDLRHFGVVGAEARLSLLPM